MGPYFWRSLNQKLALDRGARGSQTPALPDRPMYRRGDGPGKSDGLKGLNVLRAFSLSGKTGRKRFQRISFTGKTGWEEEEREEEEKQVGVPEGRATKRASAVKTRTRASRLPATTFFHRVAQHYCCNYGHHYRHQRLAPESHLLL